MGSDSPTLLVLGAGLLHGGHYRALRRGGFRSIAMDRNPEAPARGEADLFVCSDPGRVESVRSAAREHRVNGILSLSEFGVIPAAVASEELGLRQVSAAAAKTARDKWLMRKAWAAAGIEQPQFENVSTLDQALAAAARIGFPLILKPRNQFGARGVRRIESRAGLECAFGQAAAFSPEGVVLETSVSGIEASIEGLIVDGHVTILACADKELRRHREFRVTRSINYPGAFTPEEAAAIQELAQRCVPALGINDSPFHLEGFVSGNRAVPIECGARGGGGHIFSDIVEQVSGVPFVAAAAGLLVGTRPALPAEPGKKGACYRFLFPPEGTFISVPNAPDFAKDSGVIDLCIPLKPGDSVREPENGVLRQGYLVTRGPDRDAAVASADRIESALQWNIR